MKRVLSIFFLFAITGVGLFAQMGGLGGNQEILNPTKWTLETSYPAEGEVTVTFKVKIEKGWYIYSQFITAGGPVPTLIAVDDTLTYRTKGIPSEISSHKKEGMDPIFEMYITKFAEEATFSKTFQYSTGDSLTGYIEYMTCDDSRCLPPTQLPFTIDLKKKQQVFESGAMVTPEDGSMDTCYGKFGCPNGDCKTEVLEANSIWLAFVLGFLGGFIALLTPCVFPMIPFTVSYFLKGKQKNRKGIINAAFYGISIVLIYSLLAVPFLLLDLPPDFLNQLSTNIYLNIFFFVIFIVFALSFFGLFELSLPHQIANRADSASNLGGFVGIFFMAVTLAIVSFSCTGPILGTLLGSLVFTTEGQYNLAAGLTGFGIALAIPFTVLAIFPQYLSNMPKSGGWLKTVKISLGFIEVALALKFLSNADMVAHWGLLKREVFLGLWVITALLLAAFLFGLLPFLDKPDKPVRNGLKSGLAALSVAFAVYCMSGIFGVNLKLLSGFPPPMHYSLRETESEIKVYTDYTEGLEAAQASGKPIMLDFTGWACVNCRKMEEQVWVDEEIKNILSNQFVIISLYVDDRTTLPKEEQYQSSLTKQKIKTIGNKWTDFQITNFKNNSQPWYVLISPDEKILSNPIGYTPDSEAYKSYLECGLGAFGG